MRIGFQSLAVHHVVQPLARNVIEKPSGILAVKVEIAGSEPGVHVAQERLLHESRFAGARLADRKEMLKPAGLIQVDGVVVAFVEADPMHREELCTLTSPAHPNRSSPGTRGAVVASTSNVHYPVTLMAVRWAEVRRVRVVRAYCFDLVAPPVSRSRIGHGASW